MTLPSSVSLVVAVLFAVWVGYELGANRTAPLTAPPARKSVPRSINDGAKEGTREDWQRIVASLSTRSVPVKRSPQTEAIEAQRKAALPPEPFGAHVAELEALADAGNADAAQALADGLEYCRFFVPASDEAGLAKQAEDRTVFQLGIADQLIDRARKAAEQQRKRVDIPEVPSLPVYQSNLAALKEQAQRCAGVDARTAQDRLPQWRQRAAELGNRTAELSYWKRVLERADVDSYSDLMQAKQTAALALQRAYASGDARALAAIGVTYAEGLFADPDPYRAYAYFYAASQMPDADIQTLPWMGKGLFGEAMGRRTHEYFSWQFAQLGAALSDEQRQSAQVWGRDLYAQCCGAKRR